MGKTIDKELIQGIISEAGVDMVLITDPYNLRYYTGFRGGEGVAVMTRDRYVS
jgi:Xaa-Pro aminopeptidase